MPYRDGIKEWTLAGGIDQVPRNGESNVISGNGAGNSIAYNGTIGIFVFGTADHGNTIRGNQIFSNNFLGIDLGGGTNIGFGATANDPDDSDGGPNNLQNFPVLTNTVVWGPATTMQGTLQSRPNRSYVLDFYHNALSDLSGYSEDENYLGAITSSTEAGGTASFSFGADVAFSNENITVTETDLTIGDTSEFGAFRMVGTATTGPGEPSVVQIQLPGANEVVTQQEGNAGWYHRLQVTTNMHSWTDAQGFRHYASGGAYGTGANGATLRAFRVVSP